MVCNQSPGMIDWLLELGAARVARPVLRGGGGSDATSLPNHLPAHGGHHLNPIEGFWRVMKDAIGAGRCFADLHLLYQRTRQVLMAHQERPIYEFHW